MLFKEDGTLPSNRNSDTVYPEPYIFDAIGIDRLFKELHSPKIFVPMLVMVAGILASSMADAKNARSPIAYTPIGTSICLMPAPSKALSEMVFNVCTIHFIGVMV